MSAAPSFDKTLPALFSAAAEHSLWPEERAVARLLETLDLSIGARHRSVALAAKLVDGARRRRDERPFLDAFLQEFGLSNQEGVALMCIAEALLRIPDEETADKLIAEKLSVGDWEAHSGKSDSLFVNASTWALMLTGGLIDVDPSIRRDASGWLGRLTRKVGEPIMRAAVRRAMRIIGGEFVVGRNIEEALERSRAESDLKLCSFDMLGEGARTQADSDRYLAAYEHAIDVIGSPHELSSISIKLSALEPRYTLLQQTRVAEQLLPRVQALARRAADRGIQMTIDAEEADRLMLSLSVIEALASDASTRDWPGLGLAVQAYGKRAPDVIDWAGELARCAKRRMTVRLVKGAYWDSEIKRAQERGLAGFPVYSRKVSTDLSYLACAGRLFRHREVIYPQFATHNAHSIAAVLELRPAGADCEFQRLHGMGRLLYGEAQRQIDNFPAVRVYAPVGEYKDLLAYLVRRLLENGANTSFVNRFMDEQVPVSTIVRDPIAVVEGLTSVPHPQVPLPRNLFKDRRNSAGLDLGNPQEVDATYAAIAAVQKKPQRAAPIINGVMRGVPDVPVTNPADRRETVGMTREASKKEITEAFDSAASAFADWNSREPAARAQCLEQAADLLEDRRIEFYDLLIREAGKNLQDAIAELREAADFCRYYALRAREAGAPKRLVGPTGESNDICFEGRGVFACISPWNFPLAIFTGQITAALVAGNAVIAKPAAPTTLIAARCVELLFEAGIPFEALHLLPAAGPVFGEVALAHPALAGVALTGSNATALTINRLLAARPGAIVPFIAETGGMNAMVVDSTALPEQVVDDVIASAFMSAGQRCSALRLLFLQEDIADTVLEMLGGALALLRVGNPMDRATDVGPVITPQAAAGLTRHVETMRRTTKNFATCSLDARHAHGSFIAPRIIELNRAAELTHEEFGPLLHVVRFAASELDQVLKDIRASGFGLTLGVQTRLESTWRRVFAGTAVGNTYVNRNMIGAVVGVQPFGGTGLSGTGPKAGGPYYLHRFANERTLTVNTTATGGDAALLALQE
jgi:RHH-type transcriptional regulator, proline utilization regulon repressor / proline dehydrogenase / delta 1-pyrroline-5-carboxylate dehydrogenase